MSLPPTRPDRPSPVGERVTRIRNALGCSKELAAEYAAHVGAQPEIDRHQVLIRNADRRIIARIPESVLG